LEGLGKQEQLWMGMVDKQYKLKLANSGIEVLKVDVVEGKLCVCRINSEEKMDDEVL
jgi:hypothetical protein